MPTEFVSSTHLWRYIEKPRRKQRTRGEKSTAGRITYKLGKGGVTNMERLCSMTEQEIMAIPGINEKSYRYIQEAIEDFRADMGSRTWSMPDFDDTELDYILHELTNRKPDDYTYLIRVFESLAQDGNCHPQIEVMERIYYKLDSIHPDEFITIMAGKGVTLDDYGL